MSGFNIASKKGKFVILYDWLCKRAFKPWLNQTIKWKSLKAAKSNVKSFKYNLTSFSQFHLLIYVATTLLSVNAFLRLKENHFKN